MSSHLENRLDAANLDNLTRSFHYTPLTKQGPPSIVDVECPRQVKYSHRAVNARAGKENTDRTVR